MANEASPTVVLRQTFRRAARTGLGWGLVFALVVVDSAAGYQMSYPTPQARAYLVAGLEHNVGIAALLGQGRNLGSISGWIPFHSMASLLPLGAIIGLLTATRLTRAEEDAGRWEYFLSGRTTRLGAAVQAALGLAGGVAVMWIPVALTAAIVGGYYDAYSTPAALFYAAAVIAAPAIFGAVGFLAAQVASSKHQANMIGGATLGIAYLLRMVSSTSPGLSSLRWVSPLGWIEAMHPMTGTSWAPGLLAALACPAIVSAGIVIASKRDLGAAALPSRAVARSRRFGFGGHVGLDVVLSRAAATAWIVALAVVSGVFGWISKAGAEAITGSTSAQDMIRRMGVIRAGAAAYLGVTLLMVAATLALGAAAQLGAVRAEEAEGRLDHLLARPVSPRIWLAAKVGVGAALLVVESVVAGAAGWVGVSTQQTGLQLGELLRAGISIVPPALLVLGVGVLVYAVLPRYAAAAGYAIIAWSFLIELVGVVTNLNHWIKDTSLLVHIAPAPAASPDWLSGSVMVGIGLAAFAAGLALFPKRDLVGS